MKPFYFCIQLNQNADEDYILESVTDLGAYECFVSENERGEKQLFGYFSSSKEELFKLFFNDFSAIEERPYPEIDWQQQWELHSPNSENGISTIHLNEFNGTDCSFKMAAGPGFGDLSHPTTQMMLTLFPENFDNREILDIGSGSGVLTIAAAKLQGFPIYGIDICKDALQHGIENAQLNSVDCTFILPEEYVKLNRSPSWIFLNMISSEQTVAFELIQSLKLEQATLLTSGILKSQRDDYLKFCEKMGWKAQRVIEKEGWLGFELLLISRFFT